MSKIGEWCLVFCLLLSMSAVLDIATAEAPHINSSQVRERWLNDLREKPNLTTDDIRLGIVLLCKEYQFPYYSLLKKLAEKESQLGQIKKCGDGGKSCGLFQYRYNTWVFLQKKFNRQDLDYRNDIDQIEMTILALKNGYWYFWGPLRRTYKTNPVILVPHE